MADELTRYYEDYNKTYGEQGYRMGSAGDTSRIRQLLEWLRSMAPDNAKVVDVGCGDMHLSTLAPEYRWTGVDIAPDMSKGKAIKQDLMTTPYPLPAEDFDVAVCSEVLEHVWDLRVVNKEIARLLKPGGIYLMSTPNYEWLDHHLTGFRPLLFDPNQRHLFEHIRQYNIETHARFLHEAGFEILDFTGADAHYGTVFAEPRNVLFTELMRGHGLKIEASRIDQILGRMFPRNSHTIMVLARKK
jgi:SAM-dependent methyltransferase